MSHRRLYGCRQSALLSALAVSAAALFSGCQSQAPAPPAPSAPANGGRSAGFTSPQPKPDVSGIPPLVLAAQKADALDQVNELLSRGEKVNDATQNGMTPLMAAATPEIAKALIDKGAKVDQQDNTGRTALIFAAGDCVITGTPGGGAAPKTDRMGKLKLLLAHKANPNLATQEGSTPLMAAIAHHGPVNGPLDVKATMDLRIQKVKALLAAGADVHAAAKAETEDHLKPGSTPLMAAAIGNAPEIAEMLIAKGAEIDAKDAQGNTALIDAARVGSKGMVKLLLEKKAKVDAVNSIGETALSVATRMRGASLADCADQLRKAGAR